MLHSNIMVYESPE
jgi:hypothetical protein